MKKERFLRSVLLLAECYQTFEQISGSHIRSLKLTPSQFDIIATLGNTDGMTFKELGEKTLITKGTLTGVVNRLEIKGLIKRTTKTQDRRSTLVQLTPKGQHEFESVFAPHVSYCKQPFAEYSEEEFASLEQALLLLKNRLTKQN